MVQINEIVISTAAATFFTSTLNLYLTETLKATIKNNFDKEIELVKKEYNIELARLNAELNSLSVKNNFKFTKLHEKRFDILELLYKSFNIKLGKLQNYISPVKSLAENQDFENLEYELYLDYHKNHNEFVNLFLDNKIFLNDKISKLIDSYLKEELKIFHLYHENHFLRKAGMPLDSKTHMAAVTAYKKVPEIIIPILKEIEKEFKDLLEN